MRGAFSAVLLAALALGVFAANANAAATPVTAKFQLRGHLPELGDKPAMRVFQTQPAYDSFRASLGDANVFPPASSLFMMFDREILALYARGADTGGRCLQLAGATALDGDAVTVDLQWQSGTCGAPSSAHYPFILVSLSRRASDGSQWIQPTRSVCGWSPPSADIRACAVLGGGAASPSASPTSSAAPIPSPTAPPSSSVPAAPPTPIATAAPTITPSPTIARTPTPSPVAVASPPSAPPEPGPNYLLIGAIVAIVLLLGGSYVLARPRRRPR